MKWWFSDFFFGLALLFAVVGWAAALSIGPGPTLIAWGLAAVGFVIAPTRRRAFTLLGIVLFIFSYVGPLILLVGFVSYLGTSIQARHRAA